jgi:hypothetical protein
MHWLKCSLAGKIWSWSAEAIRVLPGIVGHQHHILIMA